MTEVTRTPGALMISPIVGAGAASVGSPSLSTVLRVSSRKKRLTKAAASEMTPVRMHGSR